jgi:hypothetical protein
MGQLPFQIFHPVRITVLLRSAIAVALAIEPSQKGVKLASPKGRRWALRARCANANDNVIGRHFQKTLA